MDDGGEAAFLVSAQRHALQRVRAVPAREGDLPAREQELYRPAGHLRGHGRKRDVGPHRALAAEGAAYELAADMDLVVPHAKQLRQVALDALDVA